MTRTTLSIALIAALAGCSGEDEQNDPTTTKTSVGTAAAGDLRVELLTDTKLETGMTPIYLRVTTAGGQLVTDATVEFTPMMTMMADPPYSHGAPVIGCTPATLGADGLYRCDAVFQMPTSAMGSWWARVGVSRPGMTEPAVVTFDPFTVTDSGCAKVFMYPPSPTTEPQTRYVVSMEFVSAPKVGLNPVLVTLHTRSADMMSFPPVEDATFVLDPQMPSMGHGSSGNVNPTPVAGRPGVYQGVIGFSMTGEWETTVTVRDGGVVVGAPKFLTNF